MDVALDADVENTARGQLRAVATGCATRLPSTTRAHRPAAPTSRNVSLGANLNIEKYSRA